MGPPSHLPASAGRAAGLVGRFLALLAMLTCAVAAGAPSASARAFAPVSADAVGGHALGSRGVVVSPGAPPLPAPLTATAWIIADMDTGQVLAARDPHGRYAPASTLKMLTALTLIPVLPPERKLVPSFDDVAVDGSKVGLVERVGYPVAELFRAMLMVSANDAANTLATSAGGVPRTAELMNAEAARLQARDTRAVNPSGLDATGQLSSPYDLALIARAGMAQPDFRAYAQTRTSSVSGPGGRRIETYNHNKLLRSYDGATGIKNGYTVRAKASFVGSARRDNRTLVVAAMRGAPDIWRDVGKLLDWGFLAASRGLPPVGQLVDPIPVLQPAAAAPQAAGLAPPVPAAAPEPALSVPALSVPAATQRDGLPKLPAVLLAAAALLTAIALRQRRMARLRRRQQPGSLPAAARAAPPHPVPVRRRPSL